MGKIETVGKCAKRKKKTEKVFRSILFIMLAATISVLVMAIVKVDEKLFLGYVVLLIVSGIYAIPYVDRYLPFLKNRKWLKKIDYLNVVDDLLLTEPTLSKSKIYCEKDFIFWRKFGVVVPFYQIAWAYVYRRRVYGITADQHINLHTKSGKKIPIYAHKKELEALMFYIAKNAPGAIFGYGKEQKKQYQSVVKENKKQSKV